MTNKQSVQRFQIGDRVRPTGSDLPFLITVVRAGDMFIEYTCVGRKWYEAHQLILEPERAAYVASERRVLGRAVTIARFQPELYRCETDAEMDYRHAIERAAYDAQGDEA